MVFGQFIRIHRLESAFERLRCRFPIEKIHFLVQPFLQIPGELLVLVR